MTEPLVEHVNLRGVAVRLNRDAGILQGVKILGLESKNGRVYRPAALERAIDLYEGARVNVNHVPHAPHAPRGYEDRIGAVRNVHTRGDGLYGDFYFNPKHQLAEQLLWDAEHAPENVGFSHNVLARTSQHDGQTIVEEITRVQSVDLVADPATTRGLFEAHDIDDAPPHFVGHLETTERLLALEAENRRLRSDFAQLQRRVFVEQTIAAARLPTELDTAAFREQCHAAGDDRALQHLIEARRQDARLLTGSRPRSIEQTREQPLGLVADAASFAAAIR